MILKDTAEVITVNTNAATQSCKIFETKQTCHNILEIAIQLISISIACFPQNKTDEEKILPGHDPEVQFCVSFLGPRQSEPLLTGGGLVQVRILTWAPGPHEELHCPY